MINVKIVAVIMASKMINDVDLEKVHELAKRLTGDSWCPYVSQMFADVVLLVDDNIAKELVDERRLFLFPSFLSGEPQFAKLLAHLTSRAVDVAYWLCPKCSTSNWNGLQICGVCSTPRR